MPPRKSTASNPPEDGAEAAPAAAPAPSKASKDKDSIGVEDLSLPKSMIARLAKGVLPANTQIQKDALLAMHKSATVFVSYIAANSNDLARMGGKKTISPQDVMSALKDAELEGFLPRLEAELKKYNDTQCDKRNSYRHRVKAEKAAAAGPEGGEGGDAADATDASLLAAQLNGVANGQADAEMQEGDGERPAKKFKGTDGHVVITPGEPVDDAEDVEDEEDDVDDDDAEDDEPEDDDGDDDGDDVADETMEGVDDGDLEGRGAMKDEALDDGNESD